MYSLTITDVRIDAELKALLPAITADEMQKLREAVQRDGGFTDPIIVWLETSTLIDGYNRYEIWETDLESDPEKAPDILLLSFSSRDAVKLWMLHRQSARRNLNESQRAVLAAHLAMTNPTSEDGEVQICTSQKDAAEEMNVSVRSVKTATKVINEGAKSLVAAVTDGTVRASDAEKILDLPKREQAAAVKEVEAGRAPTVAKAAQQKSSSKDENLLEQLANGAPHTVIRPYHESKVIDELLSQLRKSIDKPVEIVAKLREAIEAKSKACGAFGTHRVFCLQKVDEFMGTYQADQLIVDVMAIATKWEKAKGQVDSQTTAIPNQVTSLKRS